MVFSYLLSNPFVFNSVRRVLAGDQKATKNFVAENLRRYGTLSVLDLGCGTGEFCKTLPSNAKYLGIDINDKFIKFARNKYESAKVKFEEGNITDDHFFRNINYDAVLLISMLHHLSDNRLEKILPLVKKINPKVILVVDRIPNPDGIFKKISVWMDKGKYVRTKEEKIEILSKYFKTVSSEIIKSGDAVQLGIICKV